MRRIALENLEPRTLLAVLPPAVHDSRVPNPIAIDGSSGDHSTPTVAVDPNDSMKLAAAWVRFDPPNLPPPIQSLVEAAYSTNGGATWTLLSVPGPIGDPTTNNPVQPFPTTTDPSIGFDRNGNFYVLVDEHNAASSAAFVLFKWSETAIAAGSTVPGQTTRVLYTDQEVPTAPILAVDNNVSSFTDPDRPTVTQTDAFSNNVYVAWAANDTAPANVTNLSQYNPNRVRIVASSNGGTTFGPVQTLDSTGISGLQRYATPRLAISQGRAGLTGGQVTAVWDDFGSGATLSPIPLDFVDSNRIQGGISQGFASTTGPVADAIDPGNSAPHIPVTTPFQIPVTVDPRFTTLSDVDFTLNLVASNLADLQIQLQAPNNGPIVTLMRNQVDASNNTISQFVGSTGANLGINGNGFTLGTTFDQQATRALVDINAQGNGRGAAAPYIGNFRPDGGNLNAFNGLSQSAVNGTWRLLITDVRNDGATPPPEFVVNGTLRLTSGMSRGTQTTVANTTVRGAAPTATAATPLGITPQATIASDNTLGAFSPFQGRLYVTYVDRFDDRRDGSLANGNPADNTDVFLKISDNGGQTWSAVHNVFGIPAPVNDDSAIHDGFSEGTSLSDIFFAGTTAHMNGRPQFQPAVAVDQNTGTLVISYYDARYDAARARVATTIAASIDGGVTFGQQAFANTPESAFEEITRQDVTLGPIPDNQSGGNPKTEGTFSYGPRQGLAVEAGHVYPVWSSNENGGLVTGNGSLRLDVRVAPMDIAAGPRVISSTMGPVGGPNDSLNNTPAADGTPQAHAFEVTFDRPVDPATVTSSNGLPQNTVFLATFENGIDGFTTDNSGPDGVGGTTDDGLWHLSTGRGNDAGHSAVTSMYYGQGEGPSGGGNYATGSRNAGQITSPPIALPTGRSLSLSFNYFLETEGDAVFFDQARVTVLDITKNSSTVIAQNNTGNLLDPSNGFQKFSTDLTSFAGDTVKLAFSFDTEDDILNDFEGWYVDDVSVFQTAVAPNLQIVARDATGALLLVQPVVQNITALNPTQFGATTFRISFTPQSTEGTYSYSVGAGVSDRIRTPSQSGNRMDQNTNAVSGESPVDIYAAPRPLGGTPFQVPYDSNTLPLIVPGPHVVSTRAVLSSGQEAPASADNLVTNDTATGLDVVFDRNMEPNLATPTFTPAQVLRIMGPAGPINGPFTIMPNPNNTDPDPTHPRTFRIGFPTQELSGTYTVVLGSSIQDARGNFVDANLNAGLDALRGNPATGLTVPITVNSTAVPVNIAPGRTVTSTIDVTDNFVIQGLTLRLNITHANDPDLEATLIAPDGVTTIKLFTGVGATGNRANFTNTVFDDAAATPIQNGGPPFFGSFNPQEPLSILKGTASDGRYILQIKNNSTTNTGILNSWSLTFQKPVPGNGMGEPVADRTSVGFRIFTMAPTNPLASNTWTAVGPASIGGGASGRIGGLALDPSDPSGNTVYVGGASGGVWKTTNFLTTDPIGPTYIPLTDFGPTFAINIGGIAVFGRNNDPNQSIVFAATGEGDVASRGVGVLRSMDGGATWTILDSSTNVDAAGTPLPITSPLLDHAFVGTTSFKIVVDPKPTVSGETIVYLALSGGNGGIWRSLDTGKHWQLMRGGQATDVVLDPNSSFLNAVSNPTGNLQIVYAAFRGEGVFISSNQGQGWALMAGGGGDPLIQDADFNPSPPVAVNAPSSNPNGAKGRIELAKPFLTGNPLEDLLYEGWLYAAVVTTGNHLDGLYLTKDFGRNWTKIRLPNQRNALASSPNLVEAVPSNNISLGDYDPLGGPVFAQGNYDVSLAIDPTNPNVVYLGGTSDGQPSGLIRVDATAISDPYSLYLSNSNPDGGAIRAATTDPVTLDMTTRPPLFYFPPPNVYDPRFDPTTGDDRGQLNFIQDPANPFVIGATHYVTNTTRFANSGANVKWIPFDEPVAGSTDQHRVFSFKDPTTGHARLVFGDDQGVFTGVDAGDGTLIQSLGSVSDLSNPNGDVPVVTGSRNGNLQITQFYYGAAQPSNLAAQIAVLRGMFYGSAQDDGFPISHPNIINDPNQPGYGNITWNGPGGDGGGVATDQTGSGTVYQYKWPCCGGNITDFFQVNNVGRTTGLLQQSQPGNVPDPQWPFTGVINFAINPLNGDQAIISSAAGRIFRTETQGRFWLPIADPPTLDGAQSLALAYGAPDPNAPGGVGSLDNFIYVGTNAGHIFVTFTGGGTAGNQWTNISAGLDGSAVQAIVTNPTRGSHEAYAVTSRGVFHMVNSAAGGATWQNITSNLFQVMHKPFSDPNLAENQLSYLASIQADWRYVIPDNFSAPNGPTHPMLYVGGEGGVYRSLDKGQTWIHFPDVALLNTPQEPSGPNQPVNVDREGGYLPNAHVTDLDLSLGNINPTTGRPDVATGPNILVASTYGRGTFAIRLAPIVFPNTTANTTALHFDLSLPNPPGPPNGSDSGVIGDGVTNVTNPVIDGLSEESAFGNLVTISLIDLTNPNNPVQIPLVAGTTQTDSVGRFSVQIAPGYFKTDGSTDGPKVIGVQATDQSGTKGNIALFQFTLITSRPGKPGAPDLEAASDKGLSNTDDITNVASGAVFDVLPSGPNQIAQSVELLRDGVVVATVQVPAGPVSIFVRLTDPGPVSDGAHVYTAVQRDIAGNASPSSDPLTVTFDTIAPNTPPATALDPNDDTGVKGDGQTKVRQPHLIGTLVPETVDPVAQVQIISSNNTVLGTAFSAPNGAYSVQFANMLADGVYAVNIRAEDVAGNLSSLSPVFVLRINNKLPTAPTIFLFTGDDSGVKGDNITNVRRPHLVGITDPGLNVDLIDTNGDVSGTPGTVLATMIADSNGNYVVQFPANLPDSIYHIQTQARDAADNKALSPILVLTIDATPPAIAPTLGIAPNDDSGVKGDGVTNVRRPHLVGVTESGGVVQIIDSGGNVLATTTANSNGQFSTQLASDLNNGVIALRARATDEAGNVGPTSAPPFNLTVITVAGDYDGDGRADLAVFRPTTAQWFIIQSTFGGELVPLGAPGDVPFQGDFDGDGKTDVAVFRPTTATWYILRSQLGPQAIQYGAPNLDIPIPADYDGDGRTDLAVFRPTTAQWIIIQSSAGARVVQLGQPNVDRPEPGDYDADGKADIAVFRPTTGQWFISQSTAGGKLVQLGQPGDLAVPAAYDGGFKTEVAVFRPSTAQWLINGPGGVRTIQFGAPNLDIPVPEDYDGDGKVDLAVFRPTTAQWFIIGSSTGGRIVQFGAPNLDIPVPEPLDVRTARFGFQTRGAFGGGDNSSGGGSGGLRTSAFDFGGLASGLAGSGSTALTRAALSAPVVIPGPASSTPAAPTATTAPPQPPATALGSLVSSATQQPPITVVLQPIQPPVNLPRHHGRARHHQHDTTLAAALHSLGRIRAGRFLLPGHEA